MGTRPGAKASTEQDDAVELQLQGFNDRGRAQVLPRKTSGENWAYQVAQVTFLRPDRSGSQPRFRFAVPEVRSMIEQVAAALGSEAHGHVRPKIGQRRDVIQEAQSVQSQLSQRECRSLDHFSWSPRAGSTSTVDSGRKWQFFVALGMLHVGKEGCFVIFGAMGSC